MKNFEKKEKKGLHNEIEISLIEGDFEFTKENIKTIEMLKEGNIDDGIEQMEERVKNNILSYKKRLNDLEGNDLNEEEQIRINKMKQRIAELEESI
jgi:hypothetical protein